MLQLIGYRKVGMSFRYVTSVDCLKIHKKSKKNPVTFELSLTWSDGQKTIIERPYIAVFDFMNLMRKSYPDSQIPELKDAKWFESVWKARKEEKKKALDEFFQKILSLPDKIFNGKEVSDFFEFPWQGGDNASSNMMLCSYEEVELRSHSSAIFTHADTEYESIDIEKADYSKLSIKPKSIAVFQNSSSNDANSTYWAVTEYSKRKSGEVDLTVGAAVSVLQRELSGWWFVHVEDTNEQGWAPAACLLPDDRSNLQDVKITGPFGEFQALRDFEGVEPDEVSCKKGEKVEVIHASLDGWWEVRCRGKVGIIPATNLEPVSSQAKLRNSLYHQIGIYKKESPPPRRNSKFSVEELYGKVDKFRKNAVQPTSSLASASKSSKADPAELSAGPQQKAKQKTGGDGDDDDDDDDRHFYINESDNSTQRSYVNVELKPRKSGTNAIKYYKVIARNESNIKPQERPVLAAGIGDVIESHVEETGEIYGKLYRLADGSFPDPKEGWISKSCLELYEPESDDFTKTDLQNPVQRLPSVVSQRPIPPKRAQDTKPVNTQNVKPAPKPRQLSNAESNGRPSAASPNKGSESEHVAKKTSCQHEPSDPRDEASVNSYVAFVPQPSSSLQQCKVHRMSRTECENILLNSATRCQFIIRESTKAGHFAISVRSINRIHHFPIELTPEKKYFIGQYNFDSLEEVISYYSENPLFESEDGTGVTLSTSLESF